MKKLLLIGFSVIFVSLNGLDQATSELFNIIVSIFNRGATTSDIKEQINLAVHNGANINGYNENNNTPLMFLMNIVDIETDINEIIEHLVSLGADVNAVNEHKMSALSFAVLKENNASVKKLVELGARVKAQIIDRCIHTEREEMAKFLIPHCADLQERDSLGASLLHDAAYLGFIGITKLLLDHKIDAHIRNTETGEYAIHRACLMPIGRFSDNAFKVEVAAAWQNVLREKKMIIELLLKRGLSLQYEDDEGLTPLHIVIKQSLNDMSLENSDIITPIEFELIEFLISCDADPLKKDHQGLSPLHYVSHTENYPIDKIMSLIEKYQPQKLAAAKAILTEDVDQLKESTQTKNRVKAFVSSAFDWVINACALYGTYRGIMLLRRPKIH